MSVIINDNLIAGNHRAPQVDWNATVGTNSILNKPTNLVHTTGNETISGTKTFNGVVKLSSTYGSNEGFLYQGASTGFVALGMYSSGTTWNGNYIQFDTNGDTKLFAKSGQKIILNSGTTQAPTPTENTTTSTQIDTVGARNTALQPINQSISDINTSISDIATIRSGAALGATAIQPNASITGATKCKITYDSKGLVTAGANLAASDIPNIASSKITAMTSYSKPSSTSAITTSDSLNVAIGKLEAALDTKQDAGSYALDNAVVHLTGNETIAGTKTFTGNPVERKANPYFCFCNTNVTKGTTPESSYNWVLSFTDSTSTTSANNAIGRVEASLNTSGTSSVYIRAYNNVESTNTSAYIGIHYPLNGTAYTYAPTPSSATDNSTKIATTAWVKSHNAVDTALVHTTGDETIAGTKTFSSTIQGTAYRALYADLAEYYEMDMKYPTGTLVQFGGDKEMTIASTDVNAVISENPAFIMNSKEKETSQPIALIGKVKIRVEGKVNKFDRIVLSENPGIAIASNDTTRKSIGRALENKDYNEEGLVLCSVRIELE